MFLDTRERKLIIPGKDPKSGRSNKLPNTLTMEKDLPFIEVYQGFKQIRRARGMGLRPKEKDVNQLKFSICYLGLKVTEQPKGFIEIHNRVRCRKEKYQ